MKPAQWAVALIVLAAMVFVITFAMNYLGGPPIINHQPGQQLSGKNLALKFLNSQEAPPKIMVKNKEGQDVEIRSAPEIECEVGTPGHHDFWFANLNPEPIVLGAKSAGCRRCSTVEVFVVPEEYRPALTAPVTLVGSGAAGPLSVIANLDFPAFRLRKDTKAVEILHDKPSITIPPQAWGWIRLGWKGENHGKRGYQAEVWMSDRETGPSATFAVSVAHFDPIRARTKLNFGVLNDQELTKGVTRDIYVWSTTRRHFRIEARPVSYRHGDPQADPFEVGKPMPLTEEELVSLAQRNNSGITANEETVGSVLSGYKIPVTVHAMSPNGKVPMDIGPFRRGVMISSPDVEMEKQLVVVGHGRVRGLVDLGTDDVGSIAFGPFPSRKGAVALPLQLVSSEKDLTLTFDPQRTPKYLTATLKGPVPLGESRRSWTLEARVLKGKVHGPFPRDKDPLYEDSAIYLQAKLPGKPVRAIRIAVSGLADES